jgi:anti-sigma regulatory factor (Ser/Thr protein kinase)
MFGCPDALLAECSYATRVYAVAFVLFCGIYLLMVNYKLLNLHALSTFLSFALSLSVIPVMGVIAVFFPGAIWWSNLIAYALVAIAVVVWAELKRRRGQSHVTLLPLADARPSLDFSVPYTDDGLASALESIDGFLKSSGLPERSSLAARLSAEELLKNIIQHNAAKRALSGWFVHKPFIDIRISLAQPGSGESLTLSLHDDGEPFNPAEAPRREGSFGLTLATAFDQRLSYKYMFGQNMTIVKI